MNLTIVQPPHGTADVARWIVGRLRASQGLLTRGALAAVPAGQPLWISTPHPVFNLRLDELATNGAIETARMTGWRFLVQSGEAALGTLEFAASSPMDLPRFSRVSDGRMAASTARAIHKAERGRFRQKGRYVLGMVRAPSIHVQALWLRHEQADGLHDLFAMLEPSPTAGPVEALLPAKSFRELLARCVNEMAPQARPGMRHGQDEPERVGVRAFDGDHPRPHG